LLATGRDVGQRQKQATTGQVILQRNPVMRGWAQSHQHGASQRTCATRLSHKNFTRLSNASNLLGQSAKSSSAS